MKNRRIIRTVAATATMASLVNVKGVSRSVLLSSNREVARLIADPASSRPAFSSLE